MAVGLFAALPAPSHAGGITLIEEGDKYLKVGGRVQIQYHREDPDTADTDKTVDQTNFRRFRAYIETGFHKDWRAKFQWDMGKKTGDSDLDLDTDVDIKDAYIEYSGIENIKIKAGSAKLPFSRETLTSSKYQQLIERTFVGDHNYGAPDKVVGLHLSGETPGEKFTYGAALAASDLDPDDDKLDFDNPINDQDDFNRGIILGGRVEWHPLGITRFRQGDFDGETRVSVGLGVFVWDNDSGNTNTDASGRDLSGGKKPDVDSVAGLELSAAARHKGGSVDVEYNAFSVETIDPAVTSGIYRGGETTLENFAVEGGYMVWPSRVELVAGYEIQDADNYQASWERRSVGANFFIKKHDLKLQTTYRMGENINGKRGSDLDEFFIQAQLLF